MPFFLLIWIVIILVGYVLGRRKADDKDAGLYFGAAILFAAICGVASAIVPPPLPGAIAVFFACFAGGLLHD